MRPCPSPLENLAAFAIAFFSGVISVIGLSNALSRSRWINRDAQDPHAKR